MIRKSLALAVSVALLCTAVDARGGGGGSGGGFGGGRGSSISRPIPRTVPRTTPKPTPRAGSKVSPGTRTPTPVPHAVYPSFLSHPLIWIMIFFGFHHYHDQERESKHG